MKTPRFKRIDFDDRLEDLNPNKPAWKSWQENIKDSYHKVEIFSPRGLASISSFQISGQSERGEEARR